MAACRSRACSGGCLPPSRGCDRRAKWSDSLLSGKGLSDDSSHRGLLQEWASLSRSVGGDATMAGAEGTRRGKPEAESREPAEPEEPEEMPLVFLCGGCRRPLGDSLSWVASQEDSNCILLRSVSSNVSVDKEQVLSKRKNENGCVLETLSCAGCSLRLGFIYRYTPRSLDYKRDLFCLSVEAVESYTLGSSEKQIVSDDKELFTLESRVEIEKSLKQMEDVLKVLETKLWEVESKLAFAGRKA